MSKKEFEERKHNNYHLKIIFSVLIMVLAFLAELYIMIVRKGDPIYLVIFGIVCLLFSYVLINSIMQIQYMQAKLQKEDHEGLLKSEKASYLIVKKSFEEIFQRLDSLEKGIQLPTEELLTAQKAIAKVNISRSKENTDALMNSNDKLLEKVFQFEDYLNSNNQRLDDQSRIMEQQIQELMLKQQEMNASLKEVQLNLKNEILQAVNAITTSQAQVIVQQPAQPVENNPIMEESFMEKVMPEEPLMEETLVEEVMPEEPLMEEPLVEEAMPEEVLMDEPLIEEPMISEEPLVEEAMPEEVLMDEPLVEEPMIPDEPLMPDMSDPNKMMSPDDIAALIANVSSDEKSVEEPVVSEEIEEEPEEEDIMIPDMSDPNKMMSPEDIAALIANL